VAPQFPHTSLADNVARLRQVLALEAVPTVVAGHSYGGQIITALGEEAPNAVGLVYVTRHSETYIAPDLARYVEFGASPRGSIAFTQAARARAILAGRDHVVPEDIKALAHRVLRHRVVLGFEAIADNTRVETVVDALVATVRTP